MPWRILVLALLAYVSATLGCAALTLDDSELPCMLADARLRVAGCTTLIQSDEAKPEERAIAFYNRGTGYEESGQDDLAIADYDEAIGLNPDYVKAFQNRGLTYADKGDYDQAIADFNEILLRSPDSAAGYDAMAWLLATCPLGQYRNGERAVQLALKAIDIDNSAARTDTLAAAYAEARQFTKAIHTEQTAISMLIGSGAQDEITQFQARLELYRHGVPYRELPKQNVSAPPG